MKNKRALLSFCTLCALFFGAIAASQASALTVDIHGRTAFTCKKGAGEVGKTFNNAHCKEDAAGEYGHYSIPENTTTELTGRSGSETLKVKATLGGVATTLTATGLSVSGSMENYKGAVWGEHYFTSSVTLVLSGVQVAPFTKCFVYTDSKKEEKGAQGVIDTETLSLITGGHLSSITMSAPGVGGVFARFWILDKNKKTSGEGGECTISGTYTLTGGVTGTPSGATMNFTHSGTTELATLNLGIGETKIKAGLEGSLTLEASAKGAGAFNPISITTVSTPFI